MKAGELTRRVEIQSNTQTRDEYGELQPSTWTTVATVWASVRMLSGLQTISDGVDVSVVKASIRIRYREGITAAMRVLYGDKVFDIQAVLPDLDRREYVDLVCEQGKSHG